MTTTKPGGFKTLLVVISVILFAHGSASAGLIPIQSITGSSDPGYAPLSALKDGILTDTYPNMWLGGNGVANETVTLYLGERLWELQSLTLYNTHNEGWNDRGTREFKVWLSPTLVTPDNNPGSTFGVEILHDTLGWYPGENPTSAQNFTIVGDPTGRYLTFRTLTYPIWGEPGVGSANNSAGLNEIQVFGVPEPSTAALLAVGMLASQLMRRRRQR